MNTSSNGPAEMSFFSARLAAYLRESHPELHDDDFVERRGDAAAEEYSAAVREGANRLDAMERANAVLFGGLRFSRYETLLGIVEEWFAEVRAESRKSFCLALLPLCGEIFDRYATGDDFDLSPAYQDLQYELTGRIQAHIEEHGIQ